MPLIADAGMDVQTVFVLRVLAQGLHHSVVSGTFCLEPGVVDPQELREDAGLAYRHCGVIAQPRLLLVECGHVHLRSSLLVHQQEPQGED